jgi:hypothetical protein
MPTNSQKEKKPDIIRDVARLQKKVQKHTEGLAAAKRELAEKAGAAAQAMRDRKKIAKKRILAGLALLETLEDPSHPLHVGNLALLNKAMTKATDRALFPLLAAQAVATPVIEAETQPVAGSTSAPPAAAETITAAADQLQAEPAAAPAPQPRPAVGQPAANPPIDDPFRATREMLERKEEKDRIAAQKLADDQAAAEAKPEPPPAAPATRQPYTPYSSDRSTVRSSVIAARTPGNLKI